LKVLIIGLGSIAQKHIASILKLDPDTLFYALRSNINSIKNDNIDNIYDLNDTPKDIDFIIISNPTSFHATTLNKIIYLNKPIFIEKPIFDKIEENVDILSLVQKNNIKTYIACNLRFHPSIIFLKNFMEKNSKKINEVNVYCGSYLPSWRGDANYSEYYSAKKNMGGGVHLDLIHELDYVIWLFGQPVNYSSKKRKVSQLQIDSYDYCTYNLEYNNFNISIILNYYRIEPKRDIEIIFDDDIYICDLLSSKITNSKREVIFVQKDFHINDTYLKQADYFIKNINSLKPYMNDIEESFNILKIALYE
jgi:predicted dehydrogenase